MDDAIDCEVQEVTASSDIISEEGMGMDEDLRHEYKGRDIKSRPVSVSLPGNDKARQVRIYITSPDGVTRERLLENPFYRTILEGEINQHVSSPPFLVA